MELISQQEAATILNVHRVTLYWWAQNPDSPLKPYMIVGGRPVYYKAEVVAVAAEYKGRKGRKQAAVA